MNRKPFFPLALSAFVAAVLGAIVFSRVGRLAAGDKPMVLHGLSFLYVFTVLLLIVVWKIKANNGKIDVEAYTCFWQNVVRYIIATDLITFGAEKICHLQFNVPLGVLDIPFSAIPNELLMWAFMGKYHSMVDIIAGIEIMGGLLLLFRKTRLIGAFVLLPLLLNILLLDCYYLDFVVITYVALELSGIIYLILLEYNRLVDFFFVAKSNLPQFNFRHKWLRYLVKTSAILIPIVVLSVHHYDINYTEITGKYDVRYWRSDDKEQSLNTCRDSVLTKIFIDRTDFVMEYNNYQRRAIGGYNYNPTTKQLIVVFRYPATLRDTLVATILPDKADLKTLTGRLGKTALSIKMERVAPVNN